MVHAEGTTSGNARFTRAKILTAGVWAGGDRPFDPPGGGPGSGGKDDVSCGVLLCLIEHVMKSPKLVERLKEVGFDLVSLRRCIEIQCRKGGRVVEGQHSAIEAQDDWRTLSHAAEINRLITTLGEPGLAELKVLEAAKTVPVKRKPKLKGRTGNLFVLEDETGHGKGSKKGR